MLWYVCILLYNNTLSQSIDLVICTDMRDGEDHVYVTDIVRSACHVAVQFYDHVVPTSVTITT